MNFTGYTSSEISRYLVFRSIEWSNFPNFLSQVIAPILLLFYPWYFVVFGVLAINTLWSLIRYRYIDAYLASIVVTPIKILTWPCAIGSSIALFMHGLYIPASIALLWPAIVGFIGIPAKLGLIERAIGTQLGFKEND